MLFSSSEAGPFVAQPVLELLNLQIHFQSTEIMYASPCPELKFIGIPDMMVYTFTPSIREAEVGDLSEAKDSLDYTASAKNT